MSHLHTYSLDETTSVLVMKTTGLLKLQNPIEFMKEVVTHRVFPDDILILQDHSQANIKISMTEINVLEAFKRKYIDNFTSVEIAIILPSEPTQSMYSLYYKGIIDNVNCKSKAFDTNSFALLWLLTKDNLKWSF